MAFLIKVGIPAFTTPGAPVITPGLAASPRPARCPMAVFGLFPFAGLCRMAALRRTGCRRSRASIRHNPAFGITTKIVRRELADADFAGKLLNDVPYEFFCHPFTPNSASTTHAAKEAAGGDSSGFRPLVQQTLHPFGYGDGSNVPSLPAKVYDCPMPFALLK